MSPTMGSGVSTARVRAVLVNISATTKALSRSPWNKSSAHTGFYAAKAPLQDFFGVIFPLRLPSPHFDIFCQYCKFILTSAPHCLQHSAETVTFFIIPPYLTVPPSFPPLCRPGRPAKSRAPRSSGALCRRYFPFRFLAKAAFFRGDIFPFCTSGFAVGVPRRPRLPEASFFRRGCLSGLSGLSGLTGG